MLTITATTFHEKLHVGEEEIILNGPPSALRGQIFISNKNAEPLRVRGLPFLHDEKISGLQNNLKGLNVSCKLQPGEQRMQDIMHEINPQTPPGTYESTLTVGGATKRLKMVVQANIEIDIIPSSIIFQGVSAGATHTAELSLVNLGNMPFQIPEVKHSTTLDMDFLCRALSIAVRDKGAEGYMPMMDELTKNINKDMAGWVSVSLKESGMTIAPGKTMLLHISLTLPKDVDPRKDYGGNLRIWDREITYSIKS